jgi:hypothetical protein
LQKRISNAQQILTRVVEAVEKERANTERITAMLKGTIFVFSSLSFVHRLLTQVQNQVLNYLFYDMVSFCLLDGTYLFYLDQAPAAVQERLQQLEAENKNLTTAINKLQEEQQQKNSLHTHLENQNRSYMQQLDDIQAKFYLLETELSQTRRKVIKQEIPLPVGVIAQPPTTSTTTTTTATPNGSAGVESPKVKKEEGVDQKQNGDSSHELADALAMAETRLEEASRLREEKVALLRENTRLRDDLTHLSADRVAASEPYPTQSHLPSQSS